MHCSCNQPVRKKNYLFLFKELKELFFFSICEKAPELFPDVNRPIAAMKMVFLKSPNRRALYRDGCPELPLPPEPIPTQWGTWLEAAIFYANHLGPIKAVVQEFNPDEARSIAKCQSLLSKTSLLSDLTFIKSNLGFLPSAIKQLEESGQSLNSSLSLIGNVEEKVAKIPGSRGDVFRDKMNSILKKNHGLQCLQEIKKVLIGQEGEGELPPGWSPGESATLKFCPIVSVDVERSFSIFKHIFTDRRQRFNEENLAKVVICNCFYGRKQKTCFSSLETEPIQCSRP